MGQCQANEGRAWGKTNESAACKYTLPHSLSIPASCPTSEAPGGFKEVCPSFRLFSGYKQLNCFAIFIWVPKKTLSACLPPVTETWELTERRLKSSDGVCVLLEDTSSTFKNSSLLFTLSYCLKMHNNTIKSNTALHRYTQTQWLIHCLCWYRNSQIPWYFLLALGPFRHGINQLYCTVPTDWVDTEQTKLQRQQAEDRFIR